MRERDERTAIVANRESRKVSTRRRQRRFTEIAMNDAQLRPAIEEHALPDLCALQHRSRIFRQVWFDDERMEMAGGDMRLQATGSDRVLQRPVNREFYRDIPIGGTTCTRVPTPVIGVNREREDIGRTH